MTGAELIAAESVIIEFETQAHDRAGRQVAVWTDGLAISTDGLRDAVYTLEDGKVYHVKIEIMQVATIGDAP